MVEQLITDAPRTMSGFTQGYILALDLGTTGNRAMLFNAEGRAVSSAYRELTQYYPQPGWLEHDPEEIWRDTDGKVDVFIAGSGTGGTITGTSLRLKELKPSLKSYVVQPAASPLLTGGEAAGHPLAGIGPNFIPAVLDTTSYDEVISAPNQVAFEFARRASAEEGILAGISSGAALWAAREVANRKEHEGQIIVVVVPSFGERYVSSSLYRDLQEEYQQK